MNHHPVPTTEHLVELYERGQLGAELGVLHLREKGDDELFAQCCIEVHNAGAIDLTRVVYQPAFAALEPSAFFTAQQLYTQLIPEMEADPMALMGCVAALVDRSAGDLSAYFPERAFQNWCQRRVGQAQRIVELAREGHPLAMRFAGAALQGCGSVPQALSFISNFTDARQVGAVSALGQMQHDEVTAKQALAALRVLFDSEDDSLRARALSACFDVLAQHPSVEDGREVVATAALGAGPLTLYGLAALLNQGHSSLDPDGTDLALTAMLEVEAAHLGTKRLVDTALYGMLGTPRETLALDKLTQLSGAVKWTAEDLGDTMYALARGPAQRCHDLLVRWLLAEEVAMGHAAAHLAKYSTERPFDATLTTAGLDDESRLVLGWKTIGYLFVHPSVCCEVLLSALRGAGEEARQELANLLLDPLLVSYPSTRDRLSGLVESDELHTPVHEVLRRFEEYQKSLHDVPDVAELRPSALERHVWSRFQGEKMRESLRRAEEKSIIRQLARTSHLLHGRRSLTMVHDTELGTRVLPIDLKKMSHFMEMPALEWWDPVGLQWMMFVGRTLGRP